MKYVKTQSSGNASRPVMRIDPGGRVEREEIHRINSDSFIFPAGQCREAHEREKHPVWQRFSKDVTARKTIIARDCSQTTRRNLSS